MLMYCLNIEYVPFYYFKNKQQRNQEANKEQEQKQSDNQNNKNKSDIIFQNKLIGI